MAIQPGDLIEGKYRIGRVLGEGGMGTVYECENIRIRRRVAIKILHEEVAKNAEIMRRFEREAQAAAQIGSKFIADVLDLGSLPGGERFMVMEFLEGEDLSDRIKNRGRLSPHEATTIALQVLNGLIAAHEALIIHRDLKPANIYLTCAKDEADEVPKILDFGVSKFVQRETLTEETQAGAMLGTPHYMAPEQAKGEAIDGRTDVYAFGIVLYQMVTGCVPFTARSLNELMFQIALGETVPAESIVPDISRSFVAIINCAMSRAPEDRFQSAMEFKEALLHWAIEEGHSGLAALATSGRYAAVRSSQNAAPPVAVLGASGPYPSQVSAQSAQPSVAEVAASGSHPNTGSARDVAMELVTTNRFHNAEAARGAPPTAVAQDPNGGVSVGAGSMMTPSGVASQVVSPVSVIDSSRRLAVILGVVGVVGCSLLGVIAFLLVRSPSPSTQPDASTKAPTTTTAVATTSAAPAEPPEDDQAVASADPHALEDDAPAATASASAGPPSTTTKTTARPVKVMTGPPPRTTAPPPPTATEPPPRPKGDNIDPWAG